ncbi:uncharacterized protein ACO6RY_07578 [Pungitius sinensis]
MDEIYANIEYDKSQVFIRPSTPAPGPRSPRSRPHGAVAVSLGLLSVLLLAGLVCLGVHSHASAAEHSSIKANLTERLWVSGDKLSSVSAERDQLKDNFSALKDNFTALSQEKDRHQLLLEQTAELSSIKANLTERLRVSGDKLSSVSAERDQLKDNFTALKDNFTALKDNFTALSQEKDRLQLLLEHSKTCPAGWRNFSCSCYLLSTSADSWNNARTDCRAKGADLVMINSPQEQKFLSSIVTRGSWIGLSDEEMEGTWKWVDGTLLTETVAYWEKGSKVVQPDNGGGDPQWGEEDCAETRNSGTTWNDVRCTDSLHWICEKMV